MAEFGANYDFGDSPLYMDDGVTTTTAACNDGSTIEPTTCLDIIRRALRLLGVLATGETPDEPIAKDAKEQLNWLIQSWVNEKLMTYYVKNELFDITAGIGTYTIGPDPSQDFNTTLPMKISSAFVRDNSSGFNLDYKLDVIPNSRYQEIFQKGILTTYPRWLLFVRSYPYGTITLWPVPNKSCQIGISQWSQFTQFVSLTDVVCLPPGFKTCLAYNLAVELAPEYGLSSDLVLRRAMETKSILKTINFEPVLMATDISLLPRRQFSLLSGLYST
jgi:hypothetical protein